MKRATIISILSVFLIALVGLSFISAAGIEIRLQNNKTEYFQEELLQAEILGTFTEGLKLENIAIYESDKVHSAPTKSNLLKLSNKYIYYAILPSAAGNYSVKIKDADYWVGQDISDEPVYQNIIIIQTTEPYLSVNPGFISTTKDFSINIKSMNDASEITATLVATGEEITKEIGYNQAKDFIFSISGLEEYTESTVEIGKAGLSEESEYSILVYIYPAAPGEEPFIPAPDSDAGEEGEGEEQVPEEIPLEEATPEQIQSCEDIAGKLCKKGEKCVGPTSFAKDIVCCLGDCEEKSDLSWIIGITILVLLIGGAAVLYLMIKRRSAPKTEEQTFSEKQAKYKSRMGMYPNLKPEAEIRGRLTKE